MYNSLSHQGLAIHKTFQKGSAAYRSIRAYMRQDRFNNIYGARKNQIARQRRFIAILCIIICVLCVGASVVLIKNILDKKRGGVPVQTTTQQTSADASVPLGTTASETGVPSVTPAVSDPSAEASGQTISEEQRVTALAALNNSVKTLLDARTGRYSVYYLNLNNGETLGYEASIPMVAASSIKIAYNTYLYKKAAEGAFSMEEQMAYSSLPYPEGDFESGTGTIQTSPDGSKFTLSEVSRLSITISDNCATNMILRKLGGIDAVNTEYMAPISAVVDYRTPVSYTDYAGNEQSGKQRTSAVDLAMYAKNLYILNKAAPASYEQLMTDLFTTEYTWGIPAGVPTQYKVAHKVGFNPAYGSNNDVGIVFAQEDYVLCVMTESADGAASQDIIGQVSRLVSDYITACHS